MSVYKEVAKLPRGSEALISLLNSEQMQLGGGLASFFSHSHNSLQFPFSAVGKQEDKVIRSETVDYVDSWNTAF